MYSGKERISIKKINVIVSWKVYEYEIRVDGVEEILPWRMEAEFDQTIHADLDSLLNALLSSNEPVEITYERRYCSKEANRKLNCIQPEKNASIFRKN